MIYRFLRVEKVAIPAAMAFIAGGLGLLAFALAFPRFIALHSRVGTEGGDFVKGLLIGLSIAFEITGISALIPALAAKRRAGRDRDSPQL
jgi:hypothetical protein